MKKTTHLVRWIAALLLAIGAVAASATAQTEGSADGSGEGSGAPALLEGSADTAIDGPIEASAAERLAERGLGVGEGVVASARRVGAAPPDPRITLLRGGNVDAEVAAVLGMEFGDLSAVETVAARWTALQAEREALVATGAEAAASLHELARRASLLSARLAANRRAGRLSVLARLQHGAALLAAREAAAARANAAREVRFIDVALEFLAARRDALGALASEDSAVAEETRLLTDVAAEGREQLGRETAITDAVEARAREAEERARQEREQARDEMERSIAEGWSALAPMLDALVADRRTAEEVLSRLTARTESFANDQVELGGQLANVLDLDPDDPATDDRVVRLFDELVERRIQARDEVRESRREIEDRRAQLGESRRRLDEVQTELTTADGDGPLATRRRELLSEQARVQEERVALDELRLANSQRRWQLIEAQINFYARSIDRLIPHLSDARRDQLFSINRANLGEVRQNMAERWVALRIVWQDRVADLDEAAAKLGTAAGAKAVGLPLIVIVILLMMLRSLPRYRDPLVLALLDLRRRASSRGGPWWIKGAELVAETLDAALILLAVVIIGRLTPHYPEARFIVSAAFWIASYRFVSEAAEVLILPRRDRASIEVNSKSGESIRVGIDLVEVRSETARLVLRTIRVGLVYLVGGRIALAGVRLILGPGFFYYWASRLFTLGFIGVVYLLGWAWRKEIVRRFAERLGERGQSLADKVKQHENKPWVVLVVLALALALAGLWLVRVGGRIAAERSGAGARVANFFFRRRLERSGDTTEVVPVHQKQPLPVAYRRIFHDHPLREATHRVARPEAKARVEKALEAWTLEAGRGTVAVVGDTGAGKTTFLSELHESWQRDREVLTTCIDDKIITQRAVHEWFDTTFELDGAVDHRATIVDAIDAGPQRVVIVDQCENLFLRAVGGFEGIDRFLDLVTLTNHRIFWVLSFDRYPWTFLHRVRDRRGYFRTVARLKPFSDADLTRLIELRNEAAGVHPHFDRLAKGKKGASTDVYEVVRTSAGYFRLLTEFSRGNPRVALHYWLLSLSCDDEGLVHVSLFERPDVEVLKSLEDELLFALTSIVQHRALRVDEIAATINADPMTCEVYVNFLRECGLVQIDAGDRVRVATPTHHAVLGRLQAENFLHLEV